MANKYGITLEQIDILEQMMCRASVKSEGKRILDCSRLKGIIEDWFYNGCTCSHRWKDAANDGYTHGRVRFIRECKLCGIQEYGTLTSNMIWAKGRVALEDIMEGLEQNKSSDE